MVNPVNDNVLGNRFWAVNDLGKLDQVEQPPAVEPDAEPEKVNPKSTIFTFAANGGDAMATSAINKAELFAASHTLNEEQVAQENQKADANLRELVGDQGIVDTLVDEVADLYAQRFDCEANDAKAACRTALRKLMVTREFDERANIALPAFDPNAPAPNRLLGEDGLNALKNAMLGLAHMLKEGEISERAVVVLADGNYYDASNRTDLLRLAAESAKKVKQLFIGEERFNKLIEQCQTALANTPDLSEVQRNQLQAKIAQLRTLADEAIALRKAATEGIKTDYQLAESTGKATKSQSFQKKQLDQIRNSLRAFRYDLDQARGTMAGGMEWLRRKADNLFSSGVSHRITTADYLAMQEADRKFNELLDEVQHATANGAQINPDRYDQDAYSMASGNVDWASKVSLADSAEAATQLSHLTNDRIRYHYSGAEKRAAENFKAIEDELGSIAEEGGSRTVTFRAGADALFNLNLLAMDVKAKAGGAVDVTAQIQVDNASGSVKVTYSVGGQAHAGASTKVGADPEKKDDEPVGGVGAKLSAEVSLGATRSVTKTYANLEEFAKTASGLNMVMTPRPREVFYAWAKAAVKGIGHLFMLGATATGFRIHRSKMDQVAYGAELRNRNVFGEMGGVFLKKRNVEVLEERTAWTVKGSAQAGAKGGLYFANGDELATNFEFEGKLGGDFAREISAKGKLYTSFVNSLSGCTVDYLENQFRNGHEELATNPETEKWAGQLKRLVDGAPQDQAKDITDGLAGLSTLLSELEESAIGKDQKDTQFWSRFAAQARQLATATALLTKRANALDDGLPGAADAKRTAKAAGEYLIPRLANPVVKVPPKIFQEEFFNVCQITKPRQSKTSAFFSFRYDVLGNVIDEKLEKYGLGDQGQDTLQEKTLNTEAVDAVDFVKETAGLVGQVRVRYTKETNVSRHRDVRPWMNTSGKKTFDVDLPVNLPMRIVLDTIARYYCKKVAGLDEVESQKWVQEFYDGFTDAFKNTIEDGLIVGAVPFLDMTLGEAAEKSPALKALLGGVSAMKDAYNDDYAFRDDTYKRLHFEIDPDGRFAGFALQDGYDTEGRVEIDPLPFLSINLSLTSSTLVNDFMVMARPKVNDLMKRADDFAQAGNPEGFKNFLARNKNGVIRLLQAGKANAANEARPKDKYWAPDCQEMANTITTCKELLKEAAKKNTLMGSLAKAFIADFDAIAREVQEQGALEDDQALDLAQRFFTAAAKAYTLAAMA